MEPTSMRSTGGELVVEAPEGAGGRRAGPVERLPALRLALWLVPFAALGVLLAHTYPDSYQQDGGHHFLQARWAFAHPEYFVDVWGRPLFVVLYALPARLGYPAAKLFTLAIALAVAWNTARLAHEHGLPRPELAIPLLFVQPSFLLLSTETMTEPLFALVLVLALRLHRAGRVAAGMWLVGLLPLARPEGFFVGLLWGAVVILEARPGTRLLRRLLSTAQLAGGMVAWCLAAWAITGDPLHVVRAWAWPAGKTYGHGPLLHYLYSRRELLAGMAMEALFTLGVAHLVITRRAKLAVAALLLVAVVHALLWRFGVFGSAGYPRYLVTVAPAMALATLDGWNLAARWARRAPRPVLVAAGAATILWGAWASAQYVDRWEASRDARAVEDMREWFLAHPRSVKRLVASQAYMAIRFDRDGAEALGMTSDPEVSRRALRELPAGTLVMGDAIIGPDFYAVGPPDIERAGFTLLRTAKYELGPRLPGQRRRGSYRQQLWLYYKQ